MSIVSSTSSRLLNTASAAANMARRSLPLILSLIAGSADIIIESLANRSERGSRFYTGVHRAYAQWREMLGLSLIVLGDIPAVLA